MDIGSSRDPALRKVRQEGRPVDASLPAAESGAEVRIGHATACAIRLDDPFERTTDPGHHLRNRGQMCGMVFCHQHVCVLWRQRVAALVGRARRAVYRNQPGDSLLLEPLTRIAERNAGLLGKLRWGESGMGTQSGVKPKFFAQVDAVKLERVNRGFDETV